MKNVSVIDELALVRSQIAELRHREKALRDIVLADHETLAGAKYRGVVTHSVRRQVNIEALRWTYPDLVEEFTTELPVAVLRVIEIEN